MRDRRILLALLGATLVLEPACTVMRSVELVPQTHFTPPNSNVEPIGTVSGQASSSSLGSPDFGSGIISRAYRDALAKKGGDLLINVTLRRKVTSFLILPIMSTTVSVTGTAARLRVGTKQLTQIIDGQVEELARQADKEDSR